MVVCYATFFLDFALLVDFCSELLLFYVQNCSCISFYFLRLPMIDIVRSQGVLFASSYPCYHHLLPCSIAEISLHTCISNLLDRLQLFSVLSFEPFADGEYCMLVRAFQQ